jgi:hypothetical protein
VKSTTKINTLTKPLIALTIPALILMKLSGTEHLGVVQKLMFALTFPLVRGMRDVIRRKKIARFAIPEMLFVLRTGAGCLLRTHLKPQTEPQTTFATTTGQRIRP